MFDPQRSFAASSALTHIDSTRISVTYIILDDPHIGSHQHAGHNMDQSGLGGTFDPQGSFMASALTHIHSTTISVTYIILDDPEVGGHQQAQHNIHHSGLGGTFDLGPSFMTSTLNHIDSQFPSESVSLTKT